MKELEKKHQEGESPEKPAQRIPFWAWIVVVVFVVGIGVGLYLGCVRWGPCGG